MFAAAVWNWLGVVEEGSESTSPDGGTDPMWIVSAVMAAPVPVAHPAKARVAEGGLGCGLGGRTFPNASDPTKTAPPWMNLRRDSMAYNAMLMIPDVDHWIVNVPALT